MLGKEDNLLYMRKHIFHLLGKAYTKGSYYIIQASLIEISTYNYQVYLYTYIGITKRIHYGALTLPVRTYVGII